MPKGGMAKATGVCFGVFVSRALYGWKTDIEGIENPAPAIMRGLSGNSFTSIVHPSGPHGSRMHFT